MFLHRQLGDYILLRRLAVGGQSEIFLAIKEGPNDFSRPLVIKALPTRHRHDANLVELFYREAFLSARFSHPNVITVHDARILRGEHCMIMDFIAGQTVADIAQRAYKRGRPLDISQSVRIIADACAGLDYAHRFRDVDEQSYSVVHRDVSPQNLMVTYLGVTKVFDFGLAKIQEEEGGGQEVLTGGKYAYMSPEQCRNKPVDARSDIFSLGTILYELSVQRRLFRRGSTEEVIEAVIDKPIRAPGEFAPDFPRSLEQIILKALARDPDQRYQSAAQMRCELLQYLSTRSKARLGHRLGEHVADLFAAERTDIAQTLRRAAEGTIEPKPVGNTPLEKLGHGDDHARTGDELPVARSEPSDIAALSAPRVEVDREVMETAHRKNRKLVAEVTRLHRRQNVLIALLCAVALVAAGLAYFNQLPTSQKGEPIEIGSP